MPLFSDYPDFNPDYTPIQMFTKGIFGGTYFRPIYSSVRNKNVNKPSRKVLNMLGNIPKEKLYCKVCDKSKNKYGVKTGQSLKVWEDKGWIYPTNSDSDLYGWVGWYCEFYLGRRCKKIDDIQIARFKSVKSRFGGMYRMYKTDKLRQLLLQWGIQAR